MFVHTLAIKRKTTAGNENQVKKFKLDSANKEETGSNLRQQTEMLNAKKEIGYQTSIAT